jgi:hypothetical protein
MTSTKVDAVKKIDPSKIDSITEVRAFLGLCSYYRKFIRRFAILAAPLTRLTRKDCHVPTESQTEECQQVIAALKDAITSEPVLMPPREDKSFFV